MFQDIRPRAGGKTADFSNEKLPWLSRNDFPVSHLRVQLRERRESSSSGDDEVN